MITVEFLCPQSIAYGANQLAACKGLSMDDINTFSRPNCTVNGLPYIWQAVQVSDGWLTGMQQPATWPDFDQEHTLDVAAANAVLAGVTVAQSMPETLPAGLVVGIGCSLRGVAGLQWSADD